MGAKWSRSFAVVENRFKVMPDRLMTCLEGAIRDALEFGKDLMVDTVETSGTEYSHSRGRRGRVVTGTLRDEISFQIEKAGKNRIEGLLGWLEGTPMYARMQELGFRHAISGKTVEGMRAIAEAREEVWIEFRQGCEECMREVTRG